MSLGIGLRMRAEADAIQGRIRVRKYGKMFAVSGRPLVPRNSAGGHTTIPALFCRVPR